MRSDIEAPALLACAALAGACSSTPRTPAAAPEGTAHAQPPPHPPAATGKATAGNVDPELVKEGYSVLRRKDQVFYCRTEIITGNRIASRVCLTASEIEGQKHDLAKSKDLMNGPGSYRCVGGACNN
ncbi:MAG TPA: hypothetical protein VHZ53_20030 [Steroidobacteraceae bacterium]|jgi:hypothetical protein|nr:hypothetical protein [Steroidobacteraceae bacterium]